MGPQHNLCSAQSFDSTGTSRVGFWGSWGSFFPSFSLGRPSQGKGISLTSEDKGGVWSWKWGKQPSLPQGCKKKN